VPELMPMDLFMAGLLAASVALIVWGVRDMRRANRRGGAA
jgi:hypothetical protein